MNCTENLINFKWFCNHGIHRIFFQSFLIDFIAPTGNN